MCDNNAQKEICMDLEKLEETVMTRFERGLGYLCLKPRDEDDARYMRVFTISQLVNTINMACPVLYPTTFTESNWRDGLKYTTLVVDIVESIKIFLEERVHDE